MATSINERQQTVGVLLIYSEIISDEQRNETICLLDRALQRIDKKRFSPIEEIFNSLLSHKEFQIDSQFRQIENTEDGSLAGLLYLPNFYALINVLKDFIHQCSQLSIVFLGQQNDSNGALLLTDSFVSADHFHQIFEKNPTSVTNDLELFLPFVSHQWTRLSNNYLQKRLKNVRFEDLSIENTVLDRFADGFYQRFVEIISAPTVQIDVYRKLIPRESSGAIAFDEPNLYVFYGQHGEASLFGIRGFVVLINGGFGRIPSYWNLIRGLQTIDACILTHFDYDAFPGLQTFIHRKTIPIADDGRLCKPDIGALFLNNTQRTRLQSSPSSKRISNSKLSVNLSQNIDQFYGDVKKLNIHTFDMIKNVTINKPSIEPVNLYKKIAFGSLDLYILHPSSLTAEDEKMIAAVQKITIRDHQPSSSVIPLHHWYSSCALLVWTPTGKSNREPTVRILYTGACPQTLVFEALTRARHLDVLHESCNQQNNQRNINNKSPLLTTNNNISKANLQKPKPLSAGTTVESNNKLITSKTKLINGKIDQNRMSTNGASTTKRTSITKESIHKPKTNGKSNIVTSKSADVNDKRKTRGEELNHSEVEKTSSSTDLSSRHSNDELNCQQTNSEDRQRPDSLDLHSDNFVESNRTTPIDEIPCQTIFVDPMLMSFVDGAPNTKNPFLESTENDENIAIVHRKIDSADCDSLPSVEEIHPQALPMEDEQQMKKMSNKKSIHQTQRLSVSSTSSNPTRKSKTNVPSGPIFHVDVAYIPHHGNENYVDSEFFRRVRARYYVLNAVEISRLTLESLIEGKQQWETQEKLPVTLVPTYDGDPLRQFFVANKIRLAELNINILAASIRCNVQYDDEGSPAQRLRFTADH